MIRQALRELRLHPGRFFSVITAIVLSVGFLALTQAFVQTEVRAAALRDASGATKADVVVRGTPSATVGERPEARTDAQVKAAYDDITAAIGKNASVTAVEQLASTYLQVTDSAGDAHALQITVVPAHEEFRWNTPVVGRVPQTVDEIAIPRDLAERMHVGVGSTVSVDSPGGTGVLPLKVSGLLANKTFFVGDGMVSQAFAARYQLAAYSTTWIVKTAAPAHQVSAQLRVSLAPLLTPDSNPDGSAAPLASTLEEYRAARLRSMAGDADIAANMLSVFGSIALLVGAIIIATTFSILIAQRRRQVGLLRAVGASRGQVFRRFLGEALVIGTIGSALGIALGIGISVLASTLVTGSAVFGVDVPWGRTALIFLAGVTTTVVAALFPMRQSLRVKPLEALRPVLTERERRRGHIAIGVTCSALVLLGLAVALLAVRDGSARGIGLAVLAGTLVTIGVLGSATLYVPLLLTAFGSLVSMLGPTARLAALNSRRNPGRAGSTAVALMLAVGLIVTLQVGQASIKSTANRELDARYPIDVMATTYSNQSKQFTPADVAQAKTLQHVAHAALVRSLETSDAMLQPWELSSEVAAALPPGISVPDGEIYLSADVLSVLGKEGAKIDVTVAGKPHSLVARGNPAGGRGLVSPATFARLGGTPRATGMILKLSDPSKALDVDKKLKQQLRPTHGEEFVTEGGALFKALLAQVLDILLLVVLALLGVATLIALMGVGNTLGLSVLERTRESALLRALGLQASGLRWMLLVEALLLSLVGAVVGVVFGVFFGWLGTTTVVHAADWGEAVLDISWPTVLGVIALALLAGVLGSVLPGRRAAKASPVEALADVG